MKIAIVGATGNVGRKIIEVLEQKKILVEDLCLLASIKHLTECRVVNFPLEPIKLIIL